MECGLKPGCAPTDSGKSGAVFAENEDGLLDFDKRERSEREKEKMEGD